MSTKSPTYRALGLDVAKMTDDEALDWMVKEPNLLRRPILKVGETLILGHDKAAYEALAKEPRWKRLQDVPSPDDARNA